MRRFFKTIFHAVLALWVLEMVIDEWSIRSHNGNVLKRDLESGEEMSEVVTSDDGRHLKRHLVALPDYQLMGGGKCVDSNGLTYDNAMFFPETGADLSAAECADKCDLHEECRGFDVRGFMCLIYFDAGKTPTAIALKSEGAGGTGEIAGTDDMGRDFSCYYKRRTFENNMVDYGQGSCLAGYYAGGDGRGIESQDACNAVCIAEPECTHSAVVVGKECSRYSADCELSGAKESYTFKKVVHLENYDKFGSGACNDDGGNRYSTLAYYLGHAGTVEDCAEKCDLFPENQGFTWSDDFSGKLCLCQFNAEDLPFDPTDEATIKAIPGASQDPGLSAQRAGECGITKTDDVAGSVCYKNKYAPECDEAELKGGVNGDPVFVGLHGQAFKFNGRSGAWYSNVSTNKLQWNLRFKEFDTCPAGENTFVTGTTITLYEPSSMPFMEPQIAHTISITVAEEDKFFTGCESGVCLGEGSLKISVDGQTDITSPGDYQLDNDGGRVIAHNTFSACSRKWYDYVVPGMDASEGEHGRLLSTKSPLEYLNDDKGDMLDPKKCMSWMKNRARDDDLFSQEGAWSTIHIETSTISFHVEYRQNNDDCFSHTIDAWISEVSDALLEEEWQGILGETRTPKFYPNGEQVTSERSYLLSAKDDKDYEVVGPFGSKFAARKENLVSSSS